MLLAAELRRIHLAGWAGMATVLYSVSRDSTFIQIDREALARDCRPRLPA
jgi:hypothetical protein